MGVKAFKLILAIAVGYFVIRDLLLRVSFGAQRVAALNSVRVILGSLDPPMGGIGTKPQMWAADQYPNLSKGRAPCFQNLWSAF